MTMYILLGILAVAVIYLWVTYNGLVTAKVRISEAFSQIDVQLKRRADLIPNLVETVKGYAKHEKAIFEDVTKARANMLSAKGIEDKAQANNQMTQTLKSLFAVAENYPTLKANENFKQLQDELEDTENKIAYARQFYNSNVMNYNTKIKVFPNVVIANMLHFVPMEFFAATDSEKKEIAVKF